MTASDRLFQGSIPTLYDCLLGPMKFQPYAEHFAARAAALAPTAILEIAAGTGIVTAALARAVPEATIVATDLNPAMLDIAARRLRNLDIRLRQADAQSLPFADAGFDLVACQFGVMFFPDRVGAYREAARVLRTGGHFLFSVWDRLEANPLTDRAMEALAALFPADPPSFFARVPFAYHDKRRIESELRAAGFTRIAGETVALPSRIGSARDAALGLCQGTPLRAEIEARGSLPRRPKSWRRRSRHSAGPAAASKRRCRLMSSAPGARLSRAAQRRSGQAERDTGRRSGRR
jgi:ubiquinone/menaquinone biosynthesis C-methylase UbiE